MESVCKAKSGWSRSKVGVGAFVKLRSRLRLQRRDRQLRKLCDNTVVAFSRIAERRIRDAIAQGEFENLPGAGKPLSLEEYFSTPEDLRIGFSILKNANCSPVEVELLKEVAQLEHAVAATSDAATRQELQRTLVHRQTQLAIALERRSPRER